MITSIKFRLLILAEILVRSCDRNLKPVYKHGRCTCQFVILLHEFSRLDIMIESIPAHGELDITTLSKCMAVDQPTTAPTFISSRSADVILSDIRPTKLAPDALNSVNSLLDELLYSILNAARTFNPTRLRTAMHKVLPTTLGKEAILEAEMELRAYYQRTVTAAGSGSSGQDGAFDVQWAFEVRVIARVPFTRTSKPLRRAAFET